MWPIIDFDHSQVLQTIGQIILHFRFFRHKNDSYKHWAVGIIKPTDSFNYQAQEDIIHKINKKVELETLAHFKVLSKKNADKIMDELLNKGFEKDKTLCKYEYRVEPISQYHLVIYRYRK